MDDEYATPAEGNSRKRIKRSRDDGCSLDPHDSQNTTSEVLVVNPPTKSQPFAAVENGIHANGHACHHEQSLRTLNGDLEAMRQLITCKMCYRFVYEPYVLTCGHTFCYSCLTQWMANKKSCPDCRAVIKDQPVPSYLVRELVLIFANRSELLPDGETSEEHHQQAREEAETVAKDKANKDSRTGGLFKGLFTRGSARMPLDAIRDHSDNVWRCPQCMTEVEDSHCYVCNVRIRTSHDDDDLAWSTDSDDEEDDELDGDLLDDEADVDFGPRDYDYDLDGAEDDDLAQFGMGEIDRLRFHRYLDGDDDDDDEDDDPSMDGFIDDGQSMASTTGAPESDVTEIRGRGRRQPRPPYTIIELPDHEDGNASTNITRSDERREHSEQLSLFGSERSADIGDDEGDDEDSDDEGPITASQRQRRGQEGRVRQRRSVAISSDGDEDGDDDDDDDDDEPDTTAPGGFSPLQYGHTTNADDSGSRNYDEDESDGPNLASYLHSARAGMVSEPSDDDDDENDDDSMNEDDEEHTDDNEESDSDDEGWGPVSRSATRYDHHLTDLTGMGATSYAIPARSYSHRLDTQVPRRIRHADRTQPPEYAAMFRNRSPARAYPRVVHSTAPVTRRLPPASAPFRPVRPAHPFGLDETLANIRHNQNRHGRSSRRHGSNVSVESSGAGGVEVSSSGSSGSSRTLH